VFFILFFLYNFGSGYNTLNENQDRTAKFSTLRKIHALLWEYELFFKVFFFKITFNISILKLFKNIKNFNLKFFKFFYQKVG
jgi:hypothetical protein